MTGSPDFVVGVYPMLADETGRFPAADFAKGSSARGALAFIATSRARAFRPSWSGDDAGDRVHRVAAILGR
ncbi:MAG: hypothetical protein ACREE9_22445 [Stellaceae bacterium]